MREAWPSVKIGEVVRQIERAENPDPAKLYRLLGVRLDGRGPFHRETITGDQTAASRLYRVEQGDFIYSRLFAWRGAFGIIDESLAGAYVSPEFPVFSIDKGRVDPRFLVSWFRLPHTLRRVEAACSGSTPLTRNRFKEPAFLSLDLPLPEIAEQGRIADHVETVANKVAEVRKLRSEVDADARALLSNAFWNIARDVSRVPMGEAAPVVRRQIEVRPEGLYPELGIRSFGKGTFHKPSLSGLEVGTKRLFRIQPGDLLFSNVFAWEGAIAVARPDDAGRCGSHRFITCLPDPKLVTPEFLCFYFLTDEGLEVIGVASPGGAGRNRTLGLHALENIIVPVPRIEEQLWFGELMTKLAAQAQEQLAGSVALDALLPTVLRNVYGA